MNAPKRRKMAPWKMKRALDFRLNPTTAEATLWPYLLKTQGWPFGWRRQTLAYGYILDFYAPTLGLAVELDGRIHDPFEDAIRDANLSQHGLYTLRLSNQQIRDDLTGSLLTIVRTCQRVASSSQRLSFFATERAYATLAFRANAAQHMA